MRIVFELNHSEIINILKEYVETKTEGLISEVRLMVKSKQNYKATWENCEVMILNQEAIENNNKLLGKDHFPELSVSIDIKK